MVTPVHRHPIERSRRLDRAFVASLLVLAAVSVVTLARRRPASPRVATPAAEARLGPDDLDAEARHVVLPPSRLPAQSWGGSRRWVLPGVSRPQALALLAGLDGAARDLRCDASGCALSPSLADVAALSPSDRSRIYGALVEVDRNPQAENTFYRSPEAGPFSATPGLPSAARPLLDALTWSRHGVPAFSDLAVVCDRLGPAGCQEFMAAMLSRPSVAVSLHVGVPGAVDRIAAAFGPDERPAVRAQLAAARASGATSVPLESLLPSWARAKLDTFPAADEERTNCFSTALRFVDAWRGEVPDGAAMDAHLRRDFEPVAGAPRFGDVLLLRAGDRAAVHAAVWLLGGYLFEKNGRGRLQAWRMVPLSEVMADFPGATSTEMWRLRASR